MKLSIGYSGIKERSHLGCPFGIFDLYAKRNYQEVEHIFLTESPFICFEPL
jgi:hypothetical protein